MPPPCADEKTSRSVLLIMISLFSLGLIGVFTMYESAHDPDWWKHVGIRHTKNSGGKNNNDQVILLDDGNMFVAPHHQGEPPKNGNNNNKNSNKEPIPILPGAPRGPGDIRIVYPQDAMPVNGRYAESRKMIDFSKVKNGTHFFADYDFAHVGVPTCFPEQNAAGSKKKFDYIDITSPNSRWAGMWLSQRPHVAFIPEFLTDEECGEVIAQASKVLVRSQVAPFQNSGQKPINDVRTSSQAWLNPSFGIGKKIVDRVMQLLHMFDPRSHEELQVLRYEFGQKYDAHNDYFDPKFYGPQPNQRAVTVFLYLTDVDEGGTTWFPMAGGRPQPSEYKSCLHGLQVRPIKRAIAVFYDMDCYGDLDPSSLHGGCSPKVGTKWGGTLWIRYPYRT
jgi:hypothetical protein